MTGHGTKTTDCELLAYSFSFFRGEKWASIVTHFAAVAKKPTILHNSFFVKIEKERWVQLENWKKRSRERTLRQIFWIFTKLGLQWREFKVLHHTPTQCVFTCFWPRLAKRRSPLIDSGFTTLLFAFCFEAALQYFEINLLTLFTKKIG